MADKKPDEDWVPEWPGQQHPRQAPPFSAENCHSVRHGAYSEKKWRPLAEKLIEQVTETVPWLSSPQFTGAVQAWARAEAQLSIISDWIDEYGFLDDEGRVRGAAHLYERLGNAAAKARARLGLDPQSFAVIAKDLAVAERMWRDDPKASAGGVNDRVREVGTAVRTELVARSKERRVAAPAMAIYSE